MKAKRVVGVLAALLLCICMIMPVNTDAAAQVRVRTVKGVTSSYTGRKSYCYVNGQKRKLTKYPIFKKSGAYMGPVGAILKNSKLKVKATAKGDKLTLTYGPNTVIVRADSRITVKQSKAPPVGNNGRRFYIFRRFSTNVDIAEGYIAEAETVGEDACYTVVKAPGGQAKTKIQYKQKGAAEPLLFLSGYKLFCNRLSCRPQSCP